MAYKYKQGMHPLLKALGVVALVAIVAIILSTSPNIGAVLFPQPAQSGIPTSFSVTLPVSEIINSADCQSQISNSPVGAPSCAVKAKVSLKIFHLTNDQPDAKPDYDGVGNLYTMACTYDTSWICHDQTGLGSRTAFTLLQDVWSVRKSSIMEYYQTSEVHYVGYCGQACPPVSSTTSNKLSVDPYVAPPTPPAPPIQPVPQNKTLSQAACNIIAPIVGPVVYNPSTNKCDCVTGTYSTVTNHCVAAPTPAAPTPTQPAQPTPAPAAQQPAQPTPAPAAQQPAQPTKPNCGTGTVYDQASNSCVLALLAPTPQPQPTPAAAASQQCGFPNELDSQGNCVTNYIAVGAIVLIAVAVILGAAYILKPKRPGGVVSASPI